MQNSPSEFNLQELANEVREAISDEEALEKFDFILGLAEETERLREGIQDAIQQIQGVKADMERREMYVVPSS